MPKVGQATGPNDICSIWYSRYQSLFTSVGYNGPTVNGIIANVHLRNTDVIKYSTCSEIRDVLAIATMNNNKSADCYGLCAEHYKLAGDLYCSFLALCFNAMFLHGYIPADATQTIICPLKTKMAIYLIFLIIGPLHWLLFSQKFLNMSC